MPDAIVIGAGPNGLVAANLLADAGWSVEVFEAQPEPGGAVRSDRGVHPDYVSDLFSAFYPLAAASPVIASLRLDREGLAWSHALRVLAHPLADGRCAVLDRLPRDTAAGLEEFAPGDGDAWTDLCTIWDRLGPNIVRGLFTPFPPLVPAARLLDGVRRAGGLALVRRLLLPVRRLGEEEFRAEAGALLLAGNALHADLPPEAAGSGGYGWLMSMLGQHHGFPVPAGGAGELTAALVRRLERRGGAVRCGTPVVEVVVRGGRAVGVRTAAGERVPARWAVLADVSAPALYGSLVGEEHLPDSVLKDLRRFQWDFATFKVDWALDARVPWTAPQAATAGTVHLADGIDGLTAFAARIAMGLVPEDPFLIFGQMTAADPTRSPAGTESAWAYTHLPHRIKGDASGQGLTGRWESSESEAMADRMEEVVERYAPGFRSRILRRRILAPPTMEAMDANLRGGALNGGTAALHQQLVFLPARPRQRTPRNAGQRPLPRVGVRAPGRRCARRAGRQCGPSGPAAPPADGPDHAPSTTLAVRLEPGAPTGRDRRGPPDRAPR